MTYSLKNTLEFAQKMDLADPLGSFRNEFYFPVINGKEVIYFCGNSLGLEPKRVKEFIEQELKDWAKWGVEGHFHAKTPWFSYHEYLRAPMAKIVGAHPEEVVIMNSLTTNLHLMMMSFYRPDKKRFKIICEGGAFPSDQYAMASQAVLHGFDPGTAVVELFPEPDENFLQKDKILEAIKQHKDELALVMMGGVNYYTGQLYDMKTITSVAHNVGAMAGFDLAHAAGNVKLNLHDWDVDFAVWCSYKYLNAGPGSVAGAFIHHRHVQNPELFRLAGWWGNEPATRFTMPSVFVPARSADSWQLSNAPVLSMSSLRASLELFDKAGMENLTAKSKVLTSYMEVVINDVLNKNNCLEEVNIITPADEQQRGCQLSVQFKTNGREVHDLLTANHITTDWRSPDVIRFAPVPLYNSFQDVYRCGQIFSMALQKIFRKKSTPV